MRQPDPDADHVPERARREVEGYRDAARARNIGVAPIVEMPTLSKRQIAAALDTSRDSAAVIAKAARYADAGWSREEMARALIEERLVDESLFRDGVTLESHAGTFLLGPDGWGRRS